MAADGRPAGSDRPDLPDRPDRVPGDLVDALLGELGGWLEGAVPAEDPAPGRPRDARTGPALRRLIGAHGLASFLVRDPVAAVAASRLPDDLRRWLALQDEANRRRIERLLDELAAVLRAFGSAGVAVMPLKGAVLATRPGVDPFRRPMADLDLLVRPADHSAARATLTSLGYRRRPDRSRRPTHDTFERPGNDRVVSIDGEHPDNPRRIELHTEVKRHLWGWVDDDELTDVLWAGSTHATVLGEPAILPTQDALLAHLAVHATSDLLLARGRLIQWLDLVEVAGGLPEGSIARAPHPRLAYPALRLAARRLAGRIPAVGIPGLAALEARVPERLTAWAASVPLHTSAGLQAGRYGPGDASTIGARWSRWAPYRWRLVVAHGDVPLPVAALRHVARVVAVARRRPV